MISQNDLKRMSDRQLEKVARMIRVEIEERRKAALEKKHIQMQNIQKRKDHGEGQFYCRPWDV